MLRNSYTKNKKKFRLFKSWIQFVLSSLSLECQDFKSLVIKKFYSLNRKKITNFYGKINSFLALSTKMDKNNLPFDVAFLCSKGKKWKYIPLKMILTYLEYWAEYIPVLSAWIYSLLDQGWRTQLEGRQEYHADHCLFPKQSFNKNYKNTQFSLLAGNW